MKRLRLIYDGRSVDSCGVQTYELLWYTQYVGNCHQPEIILYIDSYAHKALNQSLKAAVQLPANQIPCGMMYPSKTALRLKV